MRNNKSEERLKKEKYYNSIGNLLRNNKTDFARRELVKFINMYPDEEYAIISYIKILIKQGNYDEVIKISKRYMDNMEIEYYLGIVYNSKMEYQKAKELFFDSYEKGMIKSLIQYIVILIKEENYEEAYNYFCSIPEEYVCDNEVEIGILRRYIYKEKYPELNLILKKEFLPYFSSQIVEYDDSILEDKIERNQILGRSRFNGEIDIKNIISYVKEKIENTEPSYYDLFDRYIIEYPKIGTVDKKNTDYLMVITNLNTKEIVNIYPCSGVYINNVEKSDVMTKKYIIE